MNVFGTTLLFIGLLISATQSFAAKSPLKSHEFPNSFLVNQQETPGASFTRKTYQLSTAKKPWKICALLPNAPDRYWWSVSYGLALAEEKLKVKLTVKDALGYENIETQKQQIRNCLNEKVDAIIIAAIGDELLEEELRLAKNQNIPVIELVNGLVGDTITAHSSVSFAEMAKVTAEYINASHGKNPRKETLAWFPGPAQAGWSKAGDTAFLNTINKTKFKILHGGFAGTDPIAQRGLIEKALRIELPNYFVGNAVAAELLSKMKNRIGGQSKIYAYYLNNSIAEKILEGKIIGAPTDFPIFQSVIAVDLAIRAIEKRPLPYHVSPIIRMITAKELRESGNSFILHPPGFRHYLSPN